MARRALSGAGGATGRSDSSCARGWRSPVSGSYRAVRRSVPMSIENPWRTTSSRISVWSTSRWCCAARPPISCHRRRSSDGPGISTSWRRPIAISSRRSTGADLARRWRRWRRRSSSLMLGDAFRSSIRSFPTRSYLGRWPAPPGEAPLRRATGRMDTSCPRVLRRDGRLAASPRAHCRLSHRNRWLSRHRPAAATFVSSQPREWWLGRHRREPGAICVERGRPEVAGRRCGARCGLSGRDPTATSCGRSRTVSGVDQVLDPSFVRSLTRG